MMTENVRSTNSPTSSTDSFPTRNVTHVTAVTLRHFSAEGPSELSVQQNDRLHILYHANRKWAFVRRCCDGQMGYVPLAFCAPIDPSVPIPSAEQVIKFVKIRTNASTMTSSPPSISDDATSVSSTASTSMSDTGLPSPASSNSSWETAKGQQRVALVLEPPKKASSLSSSSGGDSGIVTGGSRGDAASGDTSSNCSTPRQTLELCATAKHIYMETELDSCFPIDYAAPLPASIASDQGSITSSSGGKLSGKHVTFNPDTEIFGGSMVSLLESVDFPQLTFLGDCLPYETRVHEDLDSIDRYTLV